MFDHRKKNLNIMSCMEDDLSTLMISVSSRDLNVNVKADIALPQGLYSVEIVEHGRFLSM